MDNQPPILIDQHNNKVYLIADDENEDVVKAMEKLKKAGYEVVYVDSKEELANIVNDAKVDKIEDRGVGLPVALIGHSGIGLETMELARTVQHSQKMLVVGADEKEILRYGDSGNVRTGSGGLERIIKEQTYMIEKLPDLVREPFIDYKAEIGKNSGGIKLKKYVNAKKFKRKKKGKKTHRRKKK